MYKTELLLSSELKENKVLQVEFTGRLPIALYNLGRQFIATDDTCTHGNASLSVGEIEEGRIYCPFHDGAFDIRTGKPAGAPCSSPVQTYTVQLEGDKIFILLDK